MGLQLTAILGDITKLDVDIIVNAANSSLRGGSGVDGAIHRAAGPELVLECMKLGGCRTGEAKLTKAYNLPSKHIIHTVGPVWQGGGASEIENLASCYRESLFLAESVSARTIAFPCISTGIYGFPAELAAETAVGTVQSMSEDCLSLEEVIFCCFSERDFQIYLSLL